MVLRTSLTMAFILVCVLSALAIEVPDFARLAHTTRPLVQAGTANLLPNADFANGLDGWRAEGAATVEKIDGEPVLRLGPIADETAARVQVYLPEPKGATLYRLRFEVNIPEDAQLARASHSGLYGWFSQASSATGSSVAERINEYRRGGGWLAREFFLFTRPDATSVYVSLIWEADAGDALLRRLEVVEAPVAAEEGRVVLQTPTGDWAELREPVPPGEATAEPTLWACEDLDRLRPYALPPSDGPRLLELSGTEGEVVVGAVGLWTPRRLEDVTVTIEPGDHATSALDVDPEVRWAVFVPRKVNYYGRGRTFYYVPDFFVDAPTIDCPAGEATALWLSYRIPEGARFEPDARWLLKVSGDGISAALPVNIHTRGFELVDLPEKTRHLYADSGRWGKRSDEQVLAEIADVRDHGYESLPLSAAGSLTVEDGRITDFVPTEDALRSMRLAQEGGMRGPFGFWTGRFPQYARQAIGLPENALEGMADGWTAELFDAQVQAMRELREDVTAAGIADLFMIAVDEPGYWKEGSPEQYAWDMRVAEASGWDSYCTTSTPPPDPLGMNVTYHCYGGGNMFRDPERAAEILALTHGEGQQAWYYCTGSYSGQMGHVLSNRYRAGFMFFRSGWDGTATWTFQRARGNAFDDFGLDQRGNEHNAQPCTTYPDPREGGASATGNLDTPQWEALRQSCYDHRYAATLQAAIDAARERNPLVATDAQEHLDALMAALPWNGDPELHEGFSSADLDATREAIAQEIERLMRE